MKIRQLDVWEKKKSREGCLSEHIRKDRCGFLIQILTCMALRQTL